MENFLKLVRSVLLIGSVFFFFAACSDENDTDLKVGSEENEELVSDRLGGYYSIPVSTDEKWAAFLPEDCEWATVLSGEGKGNGTILLYIEDNSTLSDHLALLTVKAGKQEIVYRIRQSNDLEGGIAENDNIDFLDAFDNKGIGRGYDITTGKSKASVFQMRGLKKLIADGGTYDGFGLYHESTIAHSMGTMIDFDSIDHKLDTLGVDLSVNIAYGKFKLDVTGKYHSAERVENANKKYNMSYSMPAYEASLDYPTIRELCLDSNTPQKDKNQMLTLGFQKMRERIIEAAQNNNSSLKSLLNQLDQTYGPMVITGAKLGGLMQINLSTDSTAIADTMHISGKVTAAIELVVTIKAGVSVGYTRAGIEVLKNSNIGFDILGGSAAERNAIGSYITNVFEVDRNEMQKLSNNWANSIVLNSEDHTKNTAEIIEVDLQPIWVLFVGEDDPNGKAYDAVRSYMLEKYNDPSKQIINLSNFD